MTDFDELVKVLDEAGLAALEAAIAAERRKRNANNYLLADED